MKDQKFERHEKEEIPSKIEELCLKWSVNYIEKNEIGNMTQILVSSPKWIENDMI